MLVLLFKNMEKYQKTEIKTKTKEQLATEQKITDFFKNQQRELSSQSNYNYQYSNFVQNKDTKYYQELRTPEALFSIYIHNDILKTMEDKSLEGAAIKKFIDNLIEKNGEKTYLQLVLVKLIEYGHQKPEDVKNFFDKDDILKLKQLTTEKEVKKYLFKNSNIQRQEFNNILNDISDQLLEKKTNNENAIISKQETEISSGSVVKVN